MKRISDPSNPPSARDFLFSWNPTVAERLKSVKIEDDSLRDGLQGAFVRKPTLELKKQLIKLSAAVGTHAAMLGFPFASKAEFDECAALLAFLDAEDMALIPRFLARATIPDVEPIIALRRGSNRQVWADFFIGCNPLRRQVEQWSMVDLLAKIRRTGEHLAKHDTLFGVSLEDATRTPLNDLRQFVQCALESGARVLTLCDTVGDSTPAGAARLVPATQEFMDEIDMTAEIWWHGHNDRGLSLANAIAAAEAGAHTISGSFLGIGERTGNTALEQVVMFLHQCGHPGYHIENLAPYCRRLAEATGVPIPDHAPIVGAQAFATSTGTHAAAILKARQLGPDFEDYVFSSIPASQLGRYQDITVGPMSGVANARYVLEQLRIDPIVENAEWLLHYCKSQNDSPTAEEIRALFCAKTAAVGGA